MASEIALLLLHRDSGAPFHEEHVASNSSRHVSLKVSRGGHCCEQRLKNVNIQVPLRTLTTKICGLPCLRVCLLGAHVPNFLVIDCDGLGVRVVFFFFEVSLMEKRAAINLFGDPLEIVVYVKSARHRFRLHSRVISSEGQC